jgi:serine/threonine protein kinase
MEYNDKTGIFSINQFYISQGLTDYTEEHIKGFIKDIASGLEYCILYIKLVHSMDIVHRDIKTDNVLLDQNGNCKIGKIIFIQLTLVFL